MGPYGLARLVTTYEWLSHILIIDVAGVRALTELGVVLLLFMIGLKLSIKRLWAMRRLVFGLGSAQVGVTSVVIGGFAWAFGNSLEAAFVLGACLALSSTAIVMQLLTEQGRFGSAVGRGSFAVVPILFLVGALGAESGGATGAALGLAVAKAAFAVLLILGAGHVLLRALFRFVGNPHSTELFMAATLLIVIATAATTHAAALSAALGAFLARLLFAETEFRHQMEADIEPFKGSLLGLFFMSVGMTINLAKILQDPGWVVLSVAGLFAIKATITTLLSRLFGFSFAQAIEMGLLLGEGGEFAFVVVGLAMSFALLPEQTAQFMLIVVSATMFLTPLAARFARTVGRVLESRDGREAAQIVDTAPELTDHVVIAGYGRTGQLLAQILDRQRIVHLALDLNAARVAEQHAAGAPVYLGDASRAPMLARIHLAHAAALVVTTDDAAAAERVVQAARRLQPQLPIVARARGQAHAERLLAQGPTQVVLEVREAGLEMGRAMLEHSGLPADAARDLIDVMRVE